MQKRQKRRKGRIIRPWSDFDVPLDDFARARAGVWPKFAAGIDSRVDSGVDLIANDRAEFAASAVDESAFDRRFDILAIVAEIRRDGAGAKIGALANNAVADVAEMRDVRAVEQNRVFKFACVADFAVVTDGCAGAYEAVRPEFTVFAYHYGAIDDNPGADDRALTDVDGPCEHGAGMYFPFNDGLHLVAEDKLVCIQ